MSKTDVTKNSKTEIELFGWGATFGYGFITARKFNTLITNPIDFSACCDMTRHMDMYGPNLETVQLFIDGKQRCKSIDKIRQQFEVEDLETKVLRFSTRNNHCIVTHEEEKGTWGLLSVDSKFEELKLKFFVRRIVLPDGFEVDWITANYDGVDLECEDGTDNKSSTAWAIDKDGTRHDIDNDVDG